MPFKTRILKIILLKHKWSEVLFFYIANKAASNKAMFYYSMQNYDVNVETNIKIKLMSHLVVNKSVNHTCITKD